MQYARDPQLYIRERLILVIRLRSGLGESEPAGMIGRICQPRPRLHTCDQASHPDRDVSALADIITPPRPGVLLGDSEAASC